MHLIELSDVNHSSTFLTQAVLQVTQMLGLYYAELASILKLQCVDVGDLANAKYTLEKNSVAWQNAEKMVLIFEALFKKFNGNEAFMCNWLRKQNSALNGVPLYLMVDEGVIDKVLEAASLESWQVRCKE